MLRILSVSLKVIPWIRNISIRSIFACLIMVGLTWGAVLDRSISSLSVATAAPLPLSSGLSVDLAQAPDSPDLNQAADKAEEASEQIYEGLERTKAVVGKTEPRNQVIEEAREHASEKWQSLADKARKAKRSASESLSPVDRINLERISESK
jgi:hypothetical protein